MNSDLGRVSSRAILTTFTFLNKKTDNRNFRQSVEMFSRVHKHAVQLKMWRDASPKLRKQILHHCGEDFLNCVCQCVMNVSTGNLPLTSAQKQKLSRHRNKLRELVLKKTPKRKKIDIIQKGGFLGALITPILSILGGLLGSNGIS